MWSQDDPWTEMSKTNHDMRRVTQCLLEEISMLPLLLLKFRLKRCAVCIHDWRMYRHVFGFRLFESDDTHSWILNGTEMIMLSERGMEA